jgi:hypothetical protein
MTRRTTDPLAPLLPLARLAAVSFVAVVATLAAVHFGAGAGAGAGAAGSTSNAALSTNVQLTATGSTSGKAGTNAQVAATEASTLLGEVKVPPGSVRLTSQPGDAPNLGQPPVQPQTSTLVTRTTWWSTPLSPNDALTWMSANPPNGLQTAASGPSLIGFDANGSGVISQADVYAETFTLPDGKTGIQLSSVVVYLPQRPAQETIPAAAKLVAVPDLPGPGGRTGASATFTDQAEISRVAAIINALPTQPPGTYNCPADTGGGLELDFESSGSAALAQVEIRASGCGGVFVATHGTRQPGLSGGAQALQQIQDVLGTRWQLTQPTQPGQPARTMP